MLVSFDAFRTFGFVGVPGKTEERSSDYAVGDRSKTHNGVCR
jgi:hypothetical protein